MLFHGNIETYNWNCSPKYGPDRWDDPAISILVICGDMCQRSESVEHYLLLGWDSSAKSPSPRTLGSIEFFLTQVNTVSIWAPWKLKFWLGPKLYRVTIFFSSEVVRLATETYIFFELWRQMPHQNISLDKVLSDSGQDCVDLSPIENYNFGWGPNFIESPSSLVQMFYDPNFIESPSSLVLMFSDLQRKLTCCSHAQDASPQHWAP